MLLTLLVHSIHCVFLELLSKKAQDMEDLYRRIDR